MRRLPHARNEPRPDSPHVVHVTGKRTSEHALLDQGATDHQRSDEQDRTDGDPGAERYAGAQQPRKTASVEREAFPKGGRRTGLSLRSCPQRSLRSATGGYFRSIAMTKDHYVGDCGRRRNVTAAPGAGIRKAINKSRRSVDRGLERARPRHAGHWQGEAICAPGSRRPKKDNLASLGAYELRRGVHSPIRITRRSAMTQ